MYISADGFKSCGEVNRYLTRLISIAIGERKLKFVVVDIPDKLLYD